MGVDDAERLGVLSATQSGALRQAIQDSIRAGPRLIELKTFTASQLDASIHLEDADAQSEFIANQIDHSPPTAVNISAYRIVKGISRGGQGAVYEAVQAATGRRVAVKVIAGGPHITSRNRARYEREVRILARLDHPGIVGILDRGRTADGSFFFVMDFVDGIPLDDWLKTQWARGHEAIGTILALFVKVASAVDCAHLIGVVHRDLKPSNILVDARGEPHVLDFGLARLTGDQMGAIEAEASRATVTGNIIGSLPWASPEQASGDTRRMGTPSDVYSIGVMLYQALTGRPPYDTSDRIQQTMKNICQVIPFAPERVRRGPLGSIEVDLSDIVMRTLAKAPHARPATGGGLSSLLQAHIAGQRPGKFQRRLRFACLVILSILSGAVIASMAAGWFHETGLMPEPVEPGPVLTNTIGMQLVRVPPGRFHMGSSPQDPLRDSNEPNYMVSLTQAFYIGRTEVTRRQYVRVMGELPDKSRFVENDGKASLPVDRVSRHQANAFCERLSQLEGRPYRLPKESEWEYACRAGLASDTSSAANDPAREIWSNQDDSRRLHPVATKEPNFWGLYDMLGNSAEWCADGFVFPSDTNEPQINPSQLPEKFAGVIRGGSVFDPLIRCRPAMREKIEPSEQRRAVGFRVVFNASSFPGSTHARPWP